MRQTWSVKDGSGRVVSALSRPWRGLLISAIIAVGSTSAQADTATGVRSATANGPSILAKADSTRYRQIFAAQKAGDWRTADRLIDSLNDDLLMGHVLYQRYMHPTAYRSKYRELRGWLAEYSDHPGGSKIYRLAKKRRPAGAAAPNRPERRAYRPTQLNNGSALRLGSKARRLDRRVRGLVRKERMKQALSEISSASTRLTASEYDSLRNRIADGYLRWGYDEKAYHHASAATRSRDAVPASDWIAGLAAWRLGETRAAADHFSHLARSTNASPRLRAAGAFWAARAKLALREPEDVVELLETAVRSGPTFYGFLAARQLGDETRIAFVRSKLDQPSTALLLQQPSVRRAVALSEIDRKDLAEADLRHNHARLDPALDPALMTLAADLNLPAAELLVASGIDHEPARPLGQLALPSGLYPVPAIDPEGGYRLDRALVLALVRQESRFRADAKSRAGARGLMQIMPRTATHITKDRSFRGGGRDRLFDPSLNMELGQRYLEELIDLGSPSGNLIDMLASYNAGPGNLAKWKARTRHDGDPLLFVESMPSRETRNYIKRVLTNFWIYRARLGEQTPSLDVAASGEWPVYQAQEASGPYASR